MKPKNSAPCWEVIMNDLECPYCNAELEVCHDDGFGYEESTPHQMTCHACKKEFIFYTSISFHYEPEKADCLNGGEHKFKPTRTYQPELARMECETCWKERPMTDAERAAQPGSAKGGEV